MTDGMFMVMVEYPGLCAAASPARVDIGHDRTFHHIPNSCTKVMPILTSHFFFYFDFRSAAAALNLGPKHIYIYYLKFIIIFKIRLYLIAKK